MATYSATGSINGKYKLILEVTESDVSQANNTSKVNWKLKLTSSSGWSFSQIGSTVKVWINGENVYNQYSQKSISANGTLSIASGSKTITHNSDGKKSVTCTAEWSQNSTANYTPGYMKPTGSFKLTDIARFPVTSISSVTRTINTATINLGYTTATPTQVQIYNGDTAIGTYTSNLGSITLTGLSPNTTYNFKARGYANGGWGAFSGVSTITTYDYSKFTALYDLTIENNMYVGFNNPSAATTKLQIMSADEKKIFYEGTYYSNKSLTLTPHQYNYLAMYAYIPNSTTGTIKYKLTTTQNGVTYVQSINKTISVSVNINKPTFTNFNYEDTDENCLSVTGDASRLVKGYSKPKITITTAQKAVAKNSATIKHYRVTIGNTSMQINANESSNVSGTFNTGVETPSISVTAVDSRGIETTVTKTATWINYSKPQIKSVKLTRENGIGTKVFFTMDASLSLVNFGKYPNNFLFNVDYVYKKKGSSTVSNEMTLFGNRFEEYDKLKFDPNTGKITQVADINFLSHEYSNVVEEFAVGTEYEVTFRVWDVLTYGSYKATLDSGIPCTTKRKNSDGTYSMGVNCFPDSGTAFQVKGFTQVKGALETQGNIETKGQLIGDGFNFNSAFTNYWGSQGDANNYTRTGMYYLAESTNTPSTYVKTIVNGSRTMGDKNDVVQMATSVSPDLPWTWVRAMQTSQGWGGWKTVTLDIGSFNGDLNNIKQSCSGYANTNATNKPSSANGYFRVQRLDDSYILQEFITYGITYSSGSHTNCSRYIRQCTAGTWGQWMKADNLRTGGILSTTNLNDLYVKATGIQMYYTVPDQYTYTNFPPGAYQYGTLIVISNNAIASTSNNWMNAQIYIPDGSKNMWFRASTNSWRKLVTGNNLQSGKVDITPTANTNTYVTVNFPVAFSKEPRVITQAWTGSPGGAVKGTGAYDVTTTSCKIGIIRTDTTKTSVMWMAYED